MFSGAFWCLRTRTPPGVSTLRHCRAASTKLQLLETHVFSVGRLLGLRRPRKAQPLAQGWAGGSGGPGPDSPSLACCDFGAFTVFSSGNRSNSSFPTLGSEGPGTGHLVGAWSGVLCKCPPLFPMVKRSHEAGTCHGGAQERGTLGQGIGMFLTKPHPESSRRPALPSASSGQMDSCFVGLVLGYNSQCRPHSPCPPLYSRHPSS